VSPPARPGLLSIGTVSCPLCSGDRETPEGQGWPGHDRSCAIGLASGTTAKGPRPTRPARLKPDTAWVDHPWDIDGRDERRRAWERAWEAGRS